MMRSKPDQIRAFYHTLFSMWGRQHWWPAHSPFEVILGAYLTQNTSWINVGKALARLRAAGLVSVDGIRRTRLRRLENLIRSSGYFRQKAQRLKTFVRFLDKHYSGSLARMFAQPPMKLREQLLALNGVGPETADSILLYAGNQPVFVVDAYTRRILERHDLIASRATYDEIRELFERALAPVGVDAAGQQPKVEMANLIGSLRGSSHSPSRMSQSSRTPLTRVFNEMHGLLVGVGKNYCLKSQMRCEECPLQKYLPKKS